MGGHAYQNTNPEELGRRLQASGPMGFIMSVYATLERLERPYYFTDCVPDFLLANEDKAAGTFLEAYNTMYGDGEHPKSFVATPHAIVHQYRKRPARMGGRGTTDSAAGSRRQVVPHEVWLSDRPLPESPAFEDEKPDVQEHVQAILGDGRRPPLWDSIEQVPDLIRPHVSEDGQTLMYVTKWEYDVYVDFVCLATTGTWAEQMVTDLEYILQTFHHRWYTGSSQLTGYHVQTIVGAPPEIRPTLYKGVSARTITWRLRQTVGYAMPAQLVREIRIELHGRGPGGDELLGELEF
jgi:hypothetical protein